MDRTEQIKNRQDSNKEILGVLSELIDRQPGLRFHQLLQAAGVNVQSPDGFIMDLFYEESVVTKERVVEKKKDWT
jgi:predicted transcriptional regulator